MGDLLLPIYKFLYTNWTNNYLGGATKGQLLTKKKFFLVSPIFAALYKYNPNLKAAPNLISKYIYLYFSFYDSFEDEDYTLSTSKNEEESRSHETTSLADDSFDKIVFTEGTYFIY